MDPQKTIRLALETALRCCDRVVVTHSIAPAHNETAQLDLEVWGVDCLASLEGEIRRVLPVDVADRNETAAGTCQEIGIIMRTPGGAPTSSELRTAVHAISDDVCERMASDKPGRLVSVSTGIGSLGVFIEVDRGAY